MDLAYLFRVLLKRKWIIIGSAILAGAIAWYFTRNEVQHYRSISRVETGFARPDEIKVEDDFKIYDADIKFSNAISDWTSPAVMSLLSYDLILHDLKDPKPFRKLSPKQMASPVYTGVNKEEAIKVFENKLETMSILTSFKPEEKKLLEFINLYGYDHRSLATSISINQVQRTDYIQVDGVTENPDLSAYMVNNVYTQFIRYIRGTRGSKSQQSLDTLYNIMVKKKQELDAKNRLSGGLYSGDPETQNSSMYMLIGDLEKQLQDEQNKKTGYNFELQKINQRLNAMNGGNSTGSENTELVLARKAMNDAYSEYLRTGDETTLARYNTLKEEFNTKYGSVKSPVINTTETRDQLLNRKSDINIDIEASAAKIRSLEIRIGQLKGNANATSYRSAAAESLQEEIKLIEREYSEARSKYNNAVEQSGQYANNFRQLQIAQPAIVPEPSKRKMMIGMAGIAALSVTILIIILLVYLDSSIKTPQLFTRMVNLKMISMVNFMKLKSQNKDLREVITELDHFKTRHEKKRSNVFRESIRKLRYEIESSGKKIFLFTSTKKGEGKTTLIQALSYSMSLSHKKILIIDTNFCNNDLTVQLEAEPILEKIASAENLNGSATSTILERVKAASKEIGLGGIYVIGSEGGDYTPSEVLPRENILQHLHSLTSEFDYIFLEGPPLNDFTDSRELIKYVDSVVAVFSATNIVKQLDKESIAFFKSLNGKFCGSVLNKVNLENVNAI